jgi:hypothetical protein
LIVPYDPDLHRRFVFSAWCAGAGEPWEVLHRLLRAGARCAVWVGTTNPALFMAYAVVMPERQTVVWAYTKERLRGQGIMRALLEHLGVRCQWPITVLFWSPVAEALIEGGWQIVRGEAGGDERRARSA